MLKRSDVFLLLWIYVNNKNNSNTVKSLFSCLCVLLQVKPMPYFLFHPWIQVAYSYTYELRPYLDLLLQMLLLEDSWQNHRIHNALKGIPDDRDGLFDTIHRSKNNHQKRAYQCIKMMVKLFME